MTKAKNLQISKSKRFISILLAIIMMFSFTTVSSITASAADACIPGSNYLGTFSFTGTNWGAYRTIKGSKMRVCIAHKPVDNNTAYVLNINCLEYGGRKVLDNYIYSGGSKDSDGYYFFVSDYFNVKSGVDYRLYYHAYDQGGNGGSRRLNVHVWYDVLA